MNHSGTDNSLPLPASTSIAPDDVNLTHLATPRCPILQELDPRCATVPITMPSRIQQTTVLQLPSHDPQTENSKKHSRLCLPITPDCLTQPLSRRTLRYISRNARLGADDDPLSPAGGRSKTIVSTVGASTFSTFDFPAQIQIPKLEDVYENNPCPPDPVPNSHIPRESPAPPSSPRANRRQTKYTMATSSAPPTSPSATSGTDSLTVLPSAPLFLRTAAYPGLDGSRNQCPSSPVSSTLAAPPAHMRAFAPFWDTIPAVTKRQMLQVTFNDVEQSVATAKAEAATTAIQLLDDEHHEKHVILVATQNYLTAAPSARGIVKLPFVPKCSVGHCPTSDVHRHHRWCFSAHIRESVGGIYGWLESPLENSLALALFCKTSSDKTRNRPSSVFRSLYNRTENSTR